jgi:hypothetical protein
MNNFESFSPAESAEGLDPSALDRLREKMKENAKKAAQDAKKEAKQKQDEDVLFDLVVSLIDTLTTKHPLVIQMVKCLEHNIPAEFILSLAALVYPTIQPKVGLKIEKHIEDPSQIDSKSLVIPDLASNMNLLVKLNLNTWITHLNNMCFLDPVRYHQRLKTLESKDNCVASAVAMFSYCNQQYLQNNNLEFNGANVAQFARLYLDNLVERLHQFTLNQKQIESGESHNTSTKEATGAIQ